MTYIVFVAITLIFAVAVTGEVPAEAQKYKVVCYFTNWSSNRKGNGSFLPENIDENLCTHIVYAFTELDPNSLTIKISDPRTDINNHFYKRITDFRQKGVKVIASLGGGSVSDSDKYGRLLANATARRTFITNVTDFIEKYNFEGLDLDLEYPVCWQGHCKPENAPQKNQFAQLVEELSQAFKPRGWLLSAAVAVNKIVIDSAYDVPRLAQHLDWIALMGYNYHGRWENYTGQNAPLYNYPGNAKIFTVDYAVKYWIQQGAPSKKIVVGIPLYGKTYTLEDAEKHGLFAPTTGPGEPGPFTRAAGILAYYEICDQINQQTWNVVNNASIGSYAYLDKKWMTFDGVDTMSLKSKYIRDSKLGGAMIWSLDHDDFRGSCGNGTYPLLSTLNQELRK